MVTGQFIIIIIAFAVLIIPIIAKWLFQTKDPCPNCAQTKLIEIDQETLDTRPIELRGNAPWFGSNIRMQADIEIRQRCTNCEHTFTKRITKTY